MHDVDLSKAASDRNLTEAPDFTAIKPGGDAQLDAYAKQEGEFSAVCAADLAEGVWRQTLARVIEAEIVPRLLLIEQMANPLRPRAHPAPSNVSDFTQALLAPDAGSAQAFVEGLEFAQTPPEAIFLDYFAPAARQLGDLWSSDECDFIDVSVGLHRLQSFMDEVDARFDCLPHGREIVGSALLVVAPGETHEFGIAMVGAFLRRAGFRVLSGSSSGCLASLHANKIDIFGVSLSCTRHVEKLGRLLARARRVSRNAALKIIVGGPVFADDPKLADVLGADGMAVNAQEAVQLARSLLRAAAAM